MPPINQRVITRGPHQSRLCGRPCLRRLSWPRIDLCRFVGRHSALSALDTCISSIKGSSPPTRTWRSLIGSPCARARAPREHREKRARFARARKPAYRKLHCELWIFRISPSADQMRGWEREKERELTRLAKRRIRVPWNYLLFEQASLLQYYARHATASAENS